MIYKHKFFLIKWAQKDASYWKPSTIIAVYNFRWKPSIIDKAVHYPRVH